MKAFISLFFALTIAPLVAADWPQYLGANRDSTWKESGVVDKFPEDGLKIRWRAPVGWGYSGPAVVGDRVYITDYQKVDGELKNDPGGRAIWEGKERTLCLDAKTGKEIWKHEHERPYSLSYPGGPRCTPTVAGGNVYTLGAEGDLWCLDAKSGQVIWHKELTKEFEVRTPIWGFSGHPLVDGDTLYCLVGGEGSVAVAFEAATGKEKWRALSAGEPGYAPPTMISHAGTKQLVIWHPQALNGLNPQSGDIYWTVPLKPSYNMSIMPPRQEGSYLFASGIGNAAALVKLDDSKPVASIEWRGTPRTAVYCVNSTPVIVNGTIYGCDCESSALMAVNLKDGKRLWETKKPTIGEQRGRHGTAYLVRHEGNRFFIFNEMGDLILANLTPEKYEEIGRFHVLEPTNEVFGRACVWSHPAFADKACFARNDKELVCVDLAAK